MTTDNRTNDPTEAQVEAAAVASINSHRSRAGLPTLATLDGVPNAAEWRDDARAALVAAQGAAPVLPSSTVDEEAAKLRQLIADLVDQGECWFDHHGGCQEHGYLSLKPGELCPHAEAKAWLKEQGR